MEYLNHTKFSPAKFEGKLFELHIEPFEYLDGRNPRLPRKSSKNYDLKADYKFYFESVFAQLQTSAELGKFAVKITVYCGLDRLGAADLDNYCKAILDGITSTKKVWKDDRQVDEVKIKRKYTQNSRSKIKLKIQKL